MADSNSKGIELAKAYVQIVPSMEGLQGQLAKLFPDGVGGEQGGKMGKNLGKSLLAAFGAYKVADKLGDVIKSAFAEGAALELSIGGIETLFKSSAGKVEQYASDAFKTAGVSANEYMENVTSFSASLISSLGGDTAKAAEAAHTAMVDMSDNANKIGTNIADIQNAYQGFAKQNYTMLDNLKLGYGGTKTEMERLLADAEKISGIKYNIDNLADVYAAVHVIQGELDITGTTAKEAATTFSGSFSSMKAAAANLLGTLTNGGDTAKALDDLDESAGNFADNFIRMGKQGVQQLDKLGDALEDGIAKKLGVSKAELEGVKTVLAAIITQIAAAQILGKLEGVTISLETLRTAALKAGTSLKNSMTGGSIAIAAAAAGGQMLASIIDGITEEIDEAHDPLTDLSADTQGTVSAAHEAAKAIAETSQKFDENMNSAEESSAAYGGMVDRLEELNAQTSLTSTEQAEMESIVQSLNEGMPELGLAIDSTTGHLNKNRAAIEAVVTSYNRQAKAQAAQESLVELYKEQAKAEEALKNATDERTAALAAGTDMQSDYGAAVNTAYVTASEAMRTVNEQIDAANTAIAELSEQEKKSADSALANMSEIQLAAQRTHSVIYTVGEDSYKVSADAADSIAELSHQYTSMLGQTTDSIYNSMDLFSKPAELAEVSAEDLVSAMDSNYERISNWSDGLAELIDRGVSDGLIEKLREAGPSSAAEIKAMTSMSDTELQDYSDKFDAAYSKAYKAAEKSLGNMRDESSRQIQNIISDVAGKSPSLQEAYDILGGYAAAGFANGLTRPEKLADIDRAAQQMVDAAYQSVKAAAGIHSPSRLFADLGGYIPQGMARGISGGMAEVSAAAADMVSAAAGEVRLPDYTSADSAHNAVRAAAKRDERTAGRLTASTAEHAQNAAESGKQAVFNLVIDSDTVASVIAPALDVINGANLNLTARGVAR
jgi:phage-related protein